MIVEPDDRAMQADQVAGADLFGDADDIPDAQCRQRCGRANGEQELPTRLHRAGKCAEMVVELACRDRFEQRALGLALRQGPEQWRMLTPRP